MQFRESVESDRATIISLMEELQDHVVKLDPIKRIRRLPGYGEDTYSGMMEYIRENEGTCIIAESAGEVVGFISGLIAKQSEDNLLSVVPTRLGVVKELYVRPQFRKQKVGKALMEQMEDYFQKCGCDSIWINLFAPNEKAHEFYKSHGYSDREIGMLKKI